jgi:hypothetical protein
MRPLQISASLVVRKVIAGEPERVDAFNLKLNTALADQNSFRKATKAYEEAAIGLTRQAGKVPQCNGFVYV